MSNDISAFGINTYSYTLRQTARQCMAQLAEKGCNEFELMMYPGHLWPAQIDAAARRELRQFIEAKQLRVVTLNMPNIDLNVAGAAREMRDYTLAILRGVVQLAGDLEVPGVVIGPGKANPLYPAPKDQLMGYFFAALDELVPLADKAGTSLYVENMPFAFLPAIDGLMAALDKYGSDRIGIVYDVANGHFVKEDIPAALRVCKERLKLVHLSDTNQHVYRHDPVGLGDVDFAPIPAALEAVGYRQRAMLEIISVSPDADREIAESASKLVQMGWPGSPAR